MASDITPQLEAVYYATPIPAGLVVLTPLAIIFDRLHFPDVYLPETGYDPEATAAEANRIERVARQDYDTQLLVAMLRALPHVKDLKEFCQFGEDGKAFGGAPDSETGPLVKALDEMIWGPPKDGFIPFFTTGHSKGLPGGKVSINYPGQLNYPATAMLHAAKLGLPLINDNPHLPMLAEGKVDLKHDARMLATILAMQCVDMALPHVRPLSPARLVELRYELKPYLQPFRTGLLKLSQQLNLQITSDSDVAEVQNAARFIVQTEVEPALAELRNALEKPTGGWIDRVFGAVKDAPSLAVAYGVSPSAFVAQLAATLGAALVNYKNARPTGHPAQSSMYYLLKLQDANARARSA